MLMFLRVIALLGFFAYPTWHGAQAIRQASRHLRTNCHLAYDGEPFKIQQVADAGCNP